MSFVWAAGTTEGSTDKFPLLQCEAVSKSFRNGRSLRNFSLHVGTREIVGLAGPRGAGKTAVLDLIAGQSKPNSGRIGFAGREIGDLSAEARLRCGIARCHDVSGILLDLTALQSVLIGAGHRQPSPYSRRGGKTDREAGREMLAFAGLACVADLPVSALDAAQRRLLAIGVALAGGPSLLLLDEPMAGMAAADCARLAALMECIRDGGVSILVTARHLPPVLDSVCDRVIALRVSEAAADDMPARGKASPAALAAS